VIAGLHDALVARSAAGRPVRVGLIGAGTFGDMFLRQAVRVPGVEIAGVVDLRTERARAALDAAGAAGVPVDDELEPLLARSPDVVVEATGATIAAIGHVRAALAAGCHVVNVTVEADALVGPALVAAATRAGRVYSLASGDQPALICELVDWARTNGFDVVAAGKGTLHRPGFERTTPDDVWDRYGFDPAEADAAGYDRRMFTSFVDGTKSAIEMAAVAAATGLGVAEGGLAFPAAGARELAEVLRPESEGGRLERAGIVEVVSSAHPDGTPVAEDLRWGVYAVIEAPDDVAVRRFRDYGLAVDATGRHAALWRPNHLIGMELMTSVAQVALLGIAMGAPSRWVADVVAVAKADLPAGTELDGEGGYAVAGRLVPAARSRTGDAVPIGLAAGIRTVRPLAAGAIVTWADVEPSPHADVLSMRTGMAADAP
jgi:predicted homoserine dehydrogenase-like protein